jgi:hypothetical protein
MKLYPAGMVDWQSVPIDACTAISSLIEEVFPESAESLSHENDRSAFPSL